MSRILFGTAGPESTACTVYSPELRSFLSVPGVFLATRLRHALSWCPDEESFVPLSDVAKAQLLEGCSLDGSYSSASMHFSLHMVCYVVVSDKGTWPGYTQSARPHVLPSAPLVLSAAYCLKHGGHGLSPRSSACLQQFFGSLSVAFTACQKSTA